MAPIRGKRINVAKKRKWDLLKSSSFLSQKAFRRKPRPRNATHAKESEITAFVSSKYNPTRIGKMVSKPEICNKNPRFAKSRLDMTVVVYLNACR